MIIAQELESQQDISADVIFPPSDLYSDEPTVETELHLEQIMLLIKCLKWLWKDRYDFYAAGNLTIYYSPHQKKSQFFRGPDFFVVLGTERKTRKSWVVWEEDGKYPNFILEILSPSTANTDKEYKKEIYQNTFRTPDYFWFDPYTLEFAGFYLTNGKYQPLEPNEKGHLWSEQLGLYLGINQGLLRYFTPAGELVPTPEETAQEETRKTAIQAQRAEKESQRAEWEARRAERLAAKLRELNIDPDTI
ncbi:Uma2 family endonuclease [Dolichospermum circinale]|uniref:Uma2 family endonuclease n=2 Tax=Dolichospermum circinale TaxID=109265 RepID=UPI00232EB51C|nr:Uma2 family endonuclease [Dolichospermum circinale]MDB9475979.1 Uma2 family endonuclease [Dolichospermum circinale CS-537/11]MDB9478980.1 Uma2 family endonuclease [Dolichospermum circinale CS-537/03]